jgi:hypothetical protein
VKPLLTALLALASPSLAQGLETPAQVAALVDSAQREVILVAPVLRVKPIADALRRAVVERDVSVKLLTGRESVNDGASFWWGLERAGAQLRTVGEVQGFELIVDRVVRVTGDAIGRVLSPTERADLEIERGPGVALSAQRALRAWVRGQVFRTFQAASRNAVQNACSNPRSARRSGV